MNRSWWFSAADCAPSSTQGIRTPKHAQNKGCIPCHSFKGTVYWTGVSKSYHFSEYQTKTCRIGTFHEKLDLLCHTVMSGVDSSPYPDLKHLETMCMLLQFNGAGIPTYHWRCSEAIGSFSIDDESSSMSTVVGPNHTWFPAKNSSLGWLALLRHWADQASV